MIDRDDKGNSPCLLLVGRLVPEERTDEQLGEGSERRAIWTELKPYFIEVRSAASFQEVSACRFDDLGLVLIQKALPLFEKRNYFSCRFLVIDEAVDQALFPL
jgi:hypothetical protein